MEIESIINELCVKKTSVNDVLIGSEIHNLKWVRYEIVRNFHIEAHLRSSTT
jgi:hypothetical protein